jgi:uncharacterized protein (TIGR00369 family)
MNSRFFMDKSCFACGTDNDNGLKLEIRESTEGVSATINAPAWTQGYKDIVHGGIVATILDEMAVWAAFKRGYKSVTGELLVRIRNPMKTDHTYSANARVTQIKHKLIKAESMIVDQDQELIASAYVKLIRTG